MKPPSCGLPLQSVEICSRPALVMAPQLNPSSTAGGDPSTQGALPNRVGQWLEYLCRHLREDKGIYICVLNWKEIKNDCPRLLFTTLSYGKPQALLTEMCAFSWCFSAESRRWIKPLLKVIKPALLYFALTPATSTSSISGSLWDEDVKGGRY